MSLQVQKRNFIENIIPVIITLKTLLEKNKIPALRELMNYLMVSEEQAPVTTGHTSVLVPELPAR